MRAVRSIPFVLAALSAARSIAEDDVDLQVRGNEVVDGDIAGQRVQNAVLLPKEERRRGAEVLEPADGFIRVRGANGAPARPGL